MGRKKGKTRRAIKESPGEMVVSGVLFLLVAVVFMTELLTFRPIDPASAEEISGSFENYEIKTKGRRRSAAYIRLCLADGSVYEVHQSCVTAALKGQVSALARGDSLSLRVAPHHGYVIELIAEGAVLLDAGAAQRRMLQSGVAFLCLGVFMLCSSTVLIVGGVVIYFKKRPMRPKHVDGKDL